MSIHRKDAKRDSVEPGIIASLRSAGASVTQLSGKGVPDLLVGFQGITRLLEVKDGIGKLTPAQTDWHRAWQGSKVYIVRLPQDALDALLAPDAPPTPRKRARTNPRKPQPPPRALPEIE